MNNTILFSTDHATSLMIDAGLTDKQIVTFIAETSNIPVNDKVYYEAHSVNKYIDHTKKGLS